MKLKEATIYKISVFILLMYIFSRVSWGAYIPKAIWGIAVFLVGGFSLIILLKRIREKVDISVILLMFMNIVLIFNRNYDLSSTGLQSFVLSTFQTVCTSFFYCVAINNSKWTRTFKITTIIYGVLCSVLTIVFLLLPSLYYSNVLSSLRAYYPSIMSVMSPDPRAGIFADYAFNGLYMAFTLIISFSYLLSKKSIEKKFMVPLQLSFILSAIGILINAKRTIILGILFAFIIVYVLFQRKKDKFFKLTLIIIILVFLAGILSYIPAFQTVYDRFIVFFEGEDENNIGTRYVMWDYAIKGFINNPLIGNGWRWVKHCVYYHGNRDAHNTFIQLLAENGIIGSLPFFSFIGLQLYRSVKLVKSIYTNKINKVSKEDAVICLFLNIFIIFYMTFTTYFYSQNCLMFYLLVSAMTTAQYKQYKQGIG